VNPDELPESDIAIVGMSGRFPGAPDVDALWRRVRAGEDCLVDLDPAQLLAAGLPPSLVAAPDYVKRSGVLEGVDTFDAGFFGIGARDAAIMDPQHRHFYEIAWEAIESAGYVPERFDGAIGVFAGCGMNTYLVNNLLTNPQLVDQIGWFLLRHTANDKDFLSTGVSYRLDLRGPSVNVQTACSTSLVAIHLAAQSLLSFECDMAVAGGVTIEVPHGRGYRYHEGEILAPDGVCRAFDAASGGTVLASGAGVVALRRLTDAYRDGDPILAVLKGSAVNNDGSRKVGYLAPSVDGHADVVKEALAVAGLSARDITLLEAHGTGTAVGDPIEVAALTEGFRASTTENGFCRLVSTKPNIGHLDTAAGVASVIKVVQAMQATTLPPLANHTAPSPLLGIERTPFVLSAEATPWELPDGQLRRAGVSSLGVGGTNAHVVLEEAPAYEPTPAAAPEQVLGLSGRTAKAVADAAERLAAHLAEHPDTNLADVAHTLATGRRAMTHRRVVTATDVAGAIEQLRTPDRRRSSNGEAADTVPGVAFLFPGGGAQYAGMGAGLDERFDVFHATVREGIELTKKLANGLDLAPLLAEGGDDERLRQADASLPAVFVTSIALAKQWMAWGVEPRTFVGHSLGEYAAAHLAGVLSFEDALFLVVTRARLMASVGGEGAAMLAVPLPETQVRELLADPACAGVSLATVNAFDECVVSGRADAVHALDERLAAGGVSCTRIPLAAAAHSALLDPILPEFLAAVRTVTLHAPQRPYLSNLTGTWITAEQATDPRYWVDHLRNTVRFADCLAAALAEGPLALVECGPGQSLSSYARRQSEHPAVAIIPTLRHPNDRIADTAHSLHAFAKLWSVGVPVALERFCGDGRRRLRLPTYPFQRERHWIEPGTGYSTTEGSAAAVPQAAGGVAASGAAGPGSTGPTRIADLDDWFWEPRWIERELVSTKRATVGPWLVVGDETDDLLQAVAAELRQRGEIVRTAGAFDPERLLPARAVAVIGAAGNDTTGLDRAASRWLGDTVAAARSLGNHPDGVARLGVVTRGATAASGLATRPVDALALGTVLVAPNEYADLTTVLVDLEAEAGAAAASAAVDELLAACDRVVARRGAARLVPDAVRVAVPAPGPDATTFVKGGTYLVTGALGGVGHVLATRLATAHDAALVIVSSEAVPEGSERERWLARHSADDPTSRRIQRVIELEAVARKVVTVVADLAHPASLRAALDDAEARIGRIDGAIHAAGRLHDRLIETVTADDHEAVIGPKARAAVVLADELARRGAGLLVLVGSTSTTLAPGGQTSYVAANAVLDALAGPRGRLRVVTIDYGVWAGTGMAAHAARKLRLGIDDGEPVEHPVLAERHTGRDGALTLTGRLDVAHDWVVGEHRTATGVALLPGTGHLDLMLTALAHAGLATAGLRNVALLEPLVVGDGAPVTVRVTVTGPDAKGRREVRIESDRGEGRAWTTHSEAEVQADASAAPASPFDLAGVERRCTLDGADVLAGPRRHLRLGARWDAVVRASLGDGEICGELALPETAAGDAGAWSAHPALLDVATAFGVHLGASDDERVLYVPVGYDAVTSSEPLPEHLVVHARRQATSTSEMLKVDLTLARPDGQVALTVRGLSLRPMRDPGAFAAAPAAPIAPVGRSVAPLLVLAEELGIREEEGALLVERLLATGSPRLIASSVDLASLREGDGTPADGAGAGDAAADPVGDVVGALTAMWRDLLGLADISPTDDFFDLGGHSLIAIRLMARIHRELGVRFQLATLFEAPTIDKLAGLVRAERPDIDAVLADAAGATASASASAGATPAAVDAGGASNSLVPIRASGTKEPFFIVHGAGGNVLYLWSLSRALPEGRPVYGFQAHGVDGRDTPDPSIEAMAERYVAALRAFKPGPYLLGGYSGGGIIAVEMVRQLEALGEKVAYLVLFDSIDPQYLGPPFASRVNHLSRNLVRHGVRELWPFLDELARRRYRRIVPTPPEKAAAREQQAKAMGYTDVSEFGIVDLEEHFGKVVHDYPLGRYDVDAALLKADEVWPIFPPDYYWSKHITGKIDIVPVPGNHHTMFAPEHAPVLAEKLTRLLDEHEPR
jgi:acyl transferase domain-containing protein/thioesterase domain-containing protein